MIQDGLNMNPSADEKKGFNNQVPEDIFAEFENTEDDSKNNADNIIVEGGFNAEKSVDKTKNKLFVMLLIIAGLFIIVFLFVFLLVKSYLNKPQNVITESDYNNLVNQNQNNSTNKDATIDTDGDGLTDLEEVKYGTSINLMDTDGDGLTDGDEVKKYKTNPLNTDTDGDGFSDFDEVKEGYNPNGPGMLN